LRHSRWSPVRSRAFSFEFAEIGDRRRKIVTGSGLWLRTIGKGRGAIIVAALDHAETGPSDRCPTGPGGGMLFLVTGPRFGLVGVEDRHADLLDRDLDLIDKHDRVKPPIRRWPRLSPDSASIRSMVANSA
jgi:hypothetical protein